MTFVIINGKIQGTNIRRQNIITLKLKAHHFISKKTERIYQKAKEELNGTNELD